MQRSSRRYHDSTQLQVFKFKMDQDTSKMQEYFLMEEEQQVTMSQQDQVTI